MSGWTNGSYVGHSNGESDFVAVKINDSGTVLWQWQVKTKLGGSFEPLRATIAL